MAKMLKIFGEEYTGISSGLKMGKIEFRFDKISICACPYPLFVLLGSLAAERNHREN